MIVDDPTLIDIVDEIPLEKNKIHLKIKQRTARKNTTLIEGLTEKHDITKIFTAMKKTLHCNGSIYDKTSIMLFGDQRQGAKNFLIINNFAKESDIVIHGY
jgi:translation initiation factor SUI1